MRGGNLQRVEQTNDVTAKPFNRVRPRCDVRESVSAGIVAEDAKLLREHGNLRVPHREVSAERIGKHHYRSVRLSVQPVVKARAVNFGIGHIENLVNNDSPALFFVSQYSLDHGYSRAGVILGI